MSESDLPGLISRVLWAAFALGVVFGAVAQRAHFCTMGALADIVTMGDWTRLRMWALAVGVAVLGFNGMAAIGWVNATDSVYARPQLIWLSNALGGAMFGFGMVLASGCGSKTLVRIGAGSLKSLVVFFVIGFAAYSSMRGMAGLLRSKTTDLVGFDIPAEFVVGYGLDFAGRYRNLPFVGALKRAAFASA